MTIKKKTSGMEERIVKSFIRIEDDLKREEKLKRCYRSLRNTRIM